MKTSFVRTLLSALILLSLLAACNLPSVATPTPFPTNTPLPALTEEMLRNANYNVQRMDGSIITYTLADGLYHQGDDPASLDYVSIFLGEHIAFGDLNGDGLEDAAVTIGENYGGTGNFVSVVAMLNVNGTPMFMDASFIDDRPLINGITIRDGEIYLDATMHGPGDGGCCPTLPTVHTYRLTGSGLVLTHFTSSPGDLVHEVMITSPAEGAQVNNPFTITGSVTVAPFENTLAYRLLLPDGTVLSQYSLMVDAPDMGAPGTFSLDLDLAAAGVSGPVRAEFYETSMADGTLVALGSVTVVLP